MENVNMKTVGLQRSVIEKFNKSNIKTYQMKIDVPHAIGIDYFWAINGCIPHTFSHVEIEKQFDHDVVLFLDIDCIPLSESAMDYYIETAYAGSIIGNVQRTNHIQNGQHVFAAPSACAISRETFLKIGQPSAIETKRSDVSEEWTWLAEDRNIPVKLTMPTKFDRAPHKYDWETNKDPWWDLADGMPKYGLGTTFGDEEHGDLFWHNFQIFHEGQQERFWNKCESILTA
jgi:hypothetical protein